MLNSVSKASGVAVYKRLLGYVLQFWPVFVIALLGNIAYSGVDSYFTYLLKPLLNKGFIHRDLAFIHWLPFIIITIFLIRGSASFVGNYCMTWVSRKVVMVLRQAVFKQLMRMPASFFDTQSSGQLLSKLIYNVNQISNAGTDAITTVVQASALIIGLLVVMFINSWQLTLLYVVVMPLIALVVRYSSRRLRKINHGIQGSMADVTHVAEEGIEGYRVIKTFGGEAYETEKFNKATNNSRFQEMKVVVTKYLSQSMIQLLAATVLAITIFFATQPQGAALLSAGGFVSLFVAMIAILKPFRDITSVNGAIQRGVAGAESIFELLDMPVEKDTGTRPIKRAKGDISFKRVNFNYQQDKPVLKDVSFDVKAGEVVALVGRSGSGKSTIASLLPRFYDCTDGSILLDGESIESYQLADLRKQFAFVSQHVVLFNDTVRNNIAYGRFDDASDEDVWKAAEAGFASEFIKSLPQGLDTIIGENGVLLSGGQRQRLAIARAILKNAPILILDEATSALDTESERYIQQALEHFMKDRTTLVVAHRLSTIENADRIIVIEDGEIVEEGTHAHLLENASHYAKLHQMQFSEPHHA